MKPINGRIRKAWVHTDTEVVLVCLSLDACAPRGRVREENGDALLRSCTEEAPLLRSVEYKKKSEVNPAGRHEARC